MLIATGKLDDATELLDELADCVVNTGNKVIQAISWSFKAHALHLSGNDKEAGELFRKSEAILTLEDPGVAVSFPTVSSYYCKFLLETGQAEKALERSLKTFGWRSKKTWQVAIDTTSLLASDMQVLGLAFLALNDKANARLYLNRQVELLKEADEWLYLPSGLNARANLHIESGDYDAARDDLSNALEISRRTGARYGEWETRINRVHLHVRSGEFRKAGKALDELDQFSGMSSYTFRDREIARLRAGLERGTKPSLMSEREVTDEASDSPVSVDSN